MRTIKHTTLAVAAIALASSSSAVGQGLIAAALATSSPEISDTPVFDCTADGVFELLGTPVLPRAAPDWLADSPGFTFDSASGLLRWKTQTGSLAVPEQYDVIRHGDRANDWVASPFH